VDHMVPRANPALSNAEYCVFAASFEPDTAQSSGLCAFVSELCKSGFHGYLLEKTPVPVSQRTLCPSFMV